ncbi:MAG: preprotein translocase subunit SecA, partial [Clostridia bacterium]
MGLIDKMFGSYSKRELKHIYPIADAVEALKEKTEALSDKQLKEKTEEFKKRFTDGESLDSLLPEAFAVCCEASWRVLGMRPFRVQIIGGIVLHQGRIAEMKTGEGKTLVATLPAYLNAISCGGVHVVTVNDYLAKFQSEWMGKLYRFLGLSVGLIYHDMPNAERKAAYNCDITYATNNELGFDYLRDNMVIYKENKVQRKHNFAIVDEVDSILIDEARTPLIISGQGDKSTDLYELANSFAKTLKKIVVKEEDSKEETDNIDADFIVDEKAKNATLTPNGVKKAENHFGVENLMDADNMTLLHHINQAIKAHGVMHNEIDYVVKDGQVIIVDEFTGRLMTGRRYNEGLHQAIEAKEAVKVERESKTLATITFQNYFRLYKKLSGMTGTAMTEDEEFRSIYKLDVVEIPTNKPVIRKDYNDQVYKTEKGKYQAVIEQIVQCHEKGQPVLVGTISIEKSELLSSMLKRRGVKHTVLNAKYHEKEAEIIAQAGKFGAVTIATNMAGRGTDIILGGNAESLSKADLKKAGYEDDIITEAYGYSETEDETILEARALYYQKLEEHKAVTKQEAEKVKEAGGLFIVGTERHESRRIDNQLRGRAGRQGDVGASRFYISLEDDIMRLFGGDRMQAMMNTLKIEEDMPIENKILSSSIENAQKKVELRNFGIRKNVLQYDDVLNRQREIIYGQRDSVLDGANLKENIEKMLEDSIKANVLMYLSNDDIHDDWNLVGLRDHYINFLTTENDLQYTKQQAGDIDRKEIEDLLIDRAKDMYSKREELYGSEFMRELERVILLRTVDQKWMDHIDNMTELKRGIGLRAYAQRDPVVEYRMEGFEMFDGMVEAIKEDTTKALLLVQIRSNE